MTISTEFPNGVASGDITNDSVVLWTRSTVPGTVTFETFPFAFESSPFDSFAGSFVATASVTDVNVPVQVEVDLSDLSVGFFPTGYFYRVTNAAGTAVTGTFIAPALTDKDFQNFNGLRFGAFADWQGQLAPFTSIANATDRELDFFVTLGDTVYADVETPALPGISLASTLDEFRIKHDEVYRDRFGSNFFGDLRGTTAQLATWDDHEIVNDFAGGAVLGTDTVNSLFEGSDGTFVNDTTVFDSGLQAFQEFNPIQARTTGETGDDRTANEADLYRYNTFGNDAATFVLDTRSFRDAPLSAPGASATEAEIQAYFEDTFDSSRTLLGDAQLEQFKVDLLAAEAAGVAWKFVMSSVPMQNFGLAVAGERWEGYAAERAEVLAFIEENDIDNVVFVSADFHGNVVNNVTYQETANGPQIETSVFDVMVGPVAYEIDLPFLLPPFNSPFGAPYGPATAAFSFNPEVIADYTALNNNTDRDQFIKELVNGQLTDLGYSPIGLEDSSIRATLVQGDYINAHTFGWTEFELDPLTQALTINTYGIDPYTQEELEADPAAIAARTPTLINQIVVRSSVFDKLLGDDSDEVLVGGIHEDLIRGFGGNDVLRGDPANEGSINSSDILSGGAGNDELFGETGNDTLRGGEGDDFIDGGSGGDFINAGTGDDKVDGKAGNDIIYGRTGNDTLTGGGGIDSFFGGQGQDILKGGSKADFIVGGSESDRLVGGKGLDNLFGDIGSDILIGGKGDDFLVGGLGSDILIGGRGADTYNFDSIDDRFDVIRDFELERDKIDIRFFFFEDEEFDSDTPFLDYVQLTQDGDDTIVGIASDGNTDSDEFQTLVILEQINSTELMRQNFVI